MSKKDQIQKNNVPVHIAIIMDGNGRWAKARGEERFVGHQEGVNSVRAVVEASAEIGVKYLTFYAFSTENWSRPKAEVDALMGLLVKTIKAEVPDLNKNNIRLLGIGNLKALPIDVQEEFEEAIQETAHNTGLTVVIALSYSSRWELKNAIHNIIKDVKQGQVKESDISDELISSYLTTKNIPDPELLIRTSGEYRISNFLLWQIAYSELFFTDKFWPEFRKEELYEAIIDYQKRERRFGKTSEQV
ncbi:MAG: isoprenyl transferase [Bacteroidales bacterium]|nr:isoprenyl transferase [Bacteroidales bacterium]